jgi:predicted transcriptional regulator of viral defense system
MLQEIEKIREFHFVKKCKLGNEGCRDFSSEFSVSDLERACPGVSRDMVCRVLRDLQARGDVECLGRGPGALWRKREKR